MPRFVFKDEFESDGVAYGPLTRDGEMVVDRWISEDEARAIAAAEGEELWES